MPGPVEADTIVAGRYTLERRISQGGVGSLWLARDEQTGETCALRLADGTGYNVDVLELAARYRAEYELSDKIRCENVVNVIDYGDWCKMPYLVAEYLQCEDLASHLRRERQLSPDLAYRVLAHTARALERAHAVGIVHGDVTPENMLVVGHGRESVVKLYNFGLTLRSFEQSVGKVTKIGSLVRLPHYASPEQMANATLDYRSDVWSLAVIGYECLTGRKPFEGDAYGDLVAKILCAPQPELVVPGCSNPSALQEWWARACAREPSRRFQSAKEMSDTLGNALGLAVVAIPGTAAATDGSGEKAPVSSAPSGASARKQSVPSIPRRMTPLGIGIVNPSLISATPTPAWSTKEVSTELKALEAQRLASASPEPDIPKEPLARVLHVNPIAQAGEAPEVRASPPSERSGDSEAPTVARRLPNSDLELPDTRAITIARPQELEPSDEIVPITASLWQRHWLLVALVTLVVSTAVVLARNFSHGPSNAGLVQSKTSSADDSQPTLSPSAVLLAPPIVPASASPTPAASPLRAAVPEPSRGMGTGSNATARRESSSKQSTKADRHRSMPDSRSADKAPAVQPTPGLPSTGTTAPVGKPVPRGTAAFDSDTPPHGVHPKSSTPQSMRDYGI